MKPAPAPEPEPEAQSAPPELKPEPEPEPEPVVLALPPPPPAPPSRARAGAPRARLAPARPDESVVRLPASAQPRAWNVWELERIAGEAEGYDPTGDEEREVLVLSLRDFADASRDLPVEFDSLVREAFDPELLDARPV